MIGIIFVLNLASMLTIPVIIILFGIIYAAFTFVIQRKVSNIKRVNEITKKMKEHQKEFMEMVKSKAPDADIKKKQNEMMALMNESMKHQMKAMIIVLPLFLVVYYWVLPVFMGTLGVTSTSANIISTPIKLTYPLLFIVAAFITGILLLILVTIRDRIHDKKIAAADNVIN
jgi:uncharacterized membrane protein (DUF106 family)